jgi:hypothetical protein
MLNQRSLLLVLSFGVATIILCTAFNHQLHLGQKTWVQGYSTRSLRQLLSIDTGISWKPDNIHDAADSHQADVVPTGVSASPSLGMALLGLFARHHTAAEKQSGSNAVVSTHTASPSPASSDAASASSAAEQQPNNHNLSALVKLWFHHNISLAKEWPEVRKECHLECSTYGNCNFETGQCDCPYGKTGPACKEMFAPACRWAHHQLVACAAGSPSAQLQQHPQLCHCLSHYAHAPALQTRIAHLSMELTTTCHVLQALSCQQPPVALPASPRSRHCCRAHLRTRPDTRQPQLHLMHCCAPLVSTTSPPPHSLDLPAHSLAAHRRPCCSPFIPSQPRATPCRLTTFIGAIISCLQLDSPRSCECHRQCRALMCGHLFNGTDTCALKGDYPDGGCWHWPGKPSDLQLSDIPDEDDDGVQFWTSGE